MAAGIINTPNTVNTLDQLYTVETGANAVVCVTSMIAANASTFDFLDATFTGTLGTFQTSDGSLIASSLRADLAADMVAIVFFIPLATPAVASKNLAGAINWTGSPSLSSTLKTAWYSLSSATGALTIDITDDCIKTTATTSYINAGVSVAAGSVQIVSLALQQTGSTPGSMGAPANFTSDRTVNAGAHRMVADHYVNSAGGTRDWTFAASVSTTGVGRMVSFAELVASSFNPQQSGGLPFTNRPLFGRSW
jgi:hypothetical protein